MTTTETCYHIVNPTPRKNGDTGRCQQEPQWMVKMVGLATVRLLLCTKHFDQFRKSVEGTKAEWSGTPINRSKRCPSCFSHEPRRRLNSGDETHRRQCENPFHDEEVKPPCSPTSPAA